LHFVILCFAHDHVLLCLVLFYAQLCFVAFCVGVCTIVLCCILCYVCDRALLCFVFLHCTSIGIRTMKCKSIELITRSRTKSKLVLLFFSHRNASNVKPLWLVCDLM
jgi:hypothetical protein